MTTCERTSERVDNRCRIDRKRCRIVTIFSRNRHRIKMLLVCIDNVCMQNMMCWCVYEISCSLQRRLRAMPYLFQSHIPEQLRLRVFNCCNVMWKAYGSFTPSDRGDDGLCRTIGEFQYINQLKFSQKSVLIKPIRLLEFSRAKFLLIESTGRKKRFCV